MNINKSRTNPNRARKQVDLKLNRARKQAEFLKNPKKHVKFLLSYFFRIDYKSRNALTAFYQQMDF